MAGFFKRLFGGGDGEDGAADAAPASGAPDEEYKGIEVRAEPIKEGGQWRIAGSLTRTRDGETLSRRFLRADLMDSRDQAVSASIEKARLIIDQNGEMLWQGDLDRPT